MDTAAIARQRSRMIGGFAAVGAGVALVLGAWTASFIANRSFQSQLLASSQQVQTLVRETGVDLVEVRSTDPDLEQSLAILRSLRSLPQGYAEQKAGEPGLFKRFGLYQSSHAEQAVEAYRDGLRRIMLPRILLRVENYLKENAANPMALYEPLKVYLMLGGQGPMDAGTVKSWVSSDWAGQAFPGADRAGMRKELNEHLDALLEDQNLAASWPGRRAPVDGTTIASARASLQTLNLADRAYAILKQKAAASGGEPWLASTVLPAGDAQAFANGEEVLALSVPYFFRREGYERSYQLGLATIQADIKKDLWVMGEDAATAGVQSQMGSLNNGIATLYSREYIAAWDKVLAALKPANYFGDPAAYGTFTKTPSPLKVVLLELRKHTSFQGGTGGLKDMAKAAAANRFSQAANVVNAASSSGGRIDAGVEISSYFKPVHDYVGDGKAQAPVDEFVAAIKQAGAAMASAKIAKGGIGSDAVQGQAAIAVGSVASASAGAPPQLQAFVSAATKGGAQAQTISMQGAISDTYAQSVLPSCQSATKDKYPFFGGSQVDATIIEVQAAFGSTGVMESFFQQRVIPLLDTSGPVWRWKTDNAVAMALDPSSPDQFAKAQQVRDLLIGGLAVKVEAQSFGGAVTAAEFSAAGTKYRFDKAAMSPRPLIWSAQGGLPEASVILYKDAAEVTKIETQGPWALFRLIDKARKENAGPQTFLATFGEGDASVVFRISLPSERNPFSRGGLWSFRCPTTL